MVKVVGGDKLLAELNRIATRARSAHVRVGFLENATYDDGTPVAAVAAINEFGKPDKGQPPRPFFRNMVAEKSPGWGEALAKQLKAADYDAEQALARVAQGIKGQLQQAIVDLDSPPLAPSTVARKGFEKPLIDSGQMLNSVDFEVKDGKPE